MGMQFLKNLEYIKESVYKNIGPEMELTDEKIRDIIVDTVFDISGQNYINLRAKKELVETVFNSIRGLDVLQPLVDDQSITEIMVNGPENIFVERDGKTERVDVRFESAGKLEDIIHSVVSRANGR